MWILKMQRLFEAALFEDEWGVAKVCECVLRGIRPSPSTVWDLPLRTVWWRLCLAQLKDAENSMFSKENVFVEKKPATFVPLQIVVDWRGSPGPALAREEPWDHQIFLKTLIFIFSYVCQSTDATHSPHCQCWQQEPCWACDHLDQSEISIVCVGQSEMSIGKSQPIRDK